MSVYALTPLAKADIFQIWIYIAKDSEEAADRVERAIYAACAFVAEAPLRGHTGLGLTTRSLRCWTLTKYPNYVIVYRPETKPLEVVAVIHGKRDLSRALKGRLGVRGA
jgi:plasmid stabilization system protein ParE